MTKSLTVGVAVITFNGVKYLSQQLESIIRQTRPVDHIVISDDRSTDGTWEFLENWAKSVPIPVTLIRNEPQLGLTRNFEQSIAAVEADIIFTADQDDVWLPNKVALLTAVFERGSDVLLTHTDAILVDAQGRDMGTTLFGELGLTSRERKNIHAGNAFVVNCRRNVVTGATAVFRKELLSLARPFPANIFHDYWLILVASAAGRVHLLELPTIHYRQHGANVVGIKKHAPLMRLRHLIWNIRGSTQINQIIGDNLAWRRNMQPRLAALPKVRPSSLGFAEATIAFYEGRETLSSNPLRRLATVVKHVLAGNYRRFSYQPWSDAVRDVLRK